MTPERVSDLVVRWARFYTRGLPDVVAERRVEEIEADLHDHIEHERARATSDPRIGLSILSRMARGVPADLSWRRQVRPVKGDSMKRFAAIIAAALGVAALAIVLDSPLLVLVSVLMIGAASLGVFVMGLGTARRGDFVIPFLAILAAGLGVAAIGVIAIVVGDRGDAPGLVLLGVAVISSVVVGAYALGVRTAERSN